MLVPLNRGLLVRSARSTSAGWKPTGRVRWRSSALRSIPRWSVPGASTRGRAQRRRCGSSSPSTKRRAAVLGQVDDGQPIAAFTTDAQLGVYVATEDGPVKALHVERFLSGGVDAAARVRQLAAAPSPRGQMDSSREHARILFAAGAVGDRLWDGLGRGSQRRGRQPPCTAAQALPDHHQSKRVLHHLRLRRCQRLPSDTTASSSTTWWWTRAGRRRAD